MVSKFFFLLYYHFSKLHMMLVRSKLLQIALPVYIVLSTAIVSGQKQPEIECDRKTHFECSDGSACIVKSYLCNKVKDCKNNEDEENCGTYFGRS